MSNVIPSFHFELLQEEEFVDVDFPLIVLDDDDDDAAAAHSSRMDETKQLLHRLAELDKEQYHPRLDCYIIQGTSSSSGRGGGREPDPWLPSSPIAGVSETWRRRICAWFYSVVDHFEFHREVVYIAMNYVDRMVGTILLASSSSNSDTSSQQQQQQQDLSSNSIDNVEFRLIAVTALYMAVKVHGIYVPAIPPPGYRENGRRMKIEIATFSLMCRGLYSIDDIEAMEARMVQAFSWYVNPPSPTRYIHALLGLCPRWTARATKGNIPDLGTYQTATDHIRDVASYLTELSVAELDFQFKSSTLVISYAAVLYGLKTATAQLPCQVKCAFIKNMITAVNLRPHDPEVIHVMDMFSDFYHIVYDESDEEEEEELLLTPPSVRPKHEDNNSNNNGTNSSTERTGQVSPIGIMHVHHDHQYEAEVNSCNSDDDDDDSDDDDSDECDNPRKRNKVDSSWVLLG